MAGRRETLHRNYGSLMLPLWSHSRLCSRRFQPRFPDRFTILANNLRRAFLALDGCWPFNGSLARRSHVCRWNGRVRSSHARRARFDGQYRNAVARIISYRRPTISLAADRCWHLRVIVNGGTVDAFVTARELVFYLQFCYQKSDYISTHTRARARTHARMHAHQDKNTLPNSF